MSLTEPQLRALRILGSHEDCVVSGATDEELRTVHSRVAYALAHQWLVDVEWSSKRVNIRSKGRQVLAEHEAGG